MRELFLICYFILFVPFSYCYFYTNQSPTCGQTNDGSKFYKLQSVGVSDATYRVTGKKVNSEECSDMIFDGKKLQMNGNYKLEPYFFQQLTLWKSVSFNLSFHDFTANEIQIRYHSSTNKNKNHCRTFSIDKSGPKFNLFHDCLFSHEEYEGLAYILELMITKQVTNYRKIAFFVPSHERIHPESTTANNWQVFIYIDITDDRNMEFHFLPMPDKFPIDSYTLQMFSEPENKLLMEKTIYQDFTFAMPSGEEQIYFNLTPVGPACVSSGCRPSRSPTIRRADTKYLSFVEFGVVGFFAFVLLVGTLVFLIMRKRLVQPKVIKRPSVLFIYKATHQAHIKVIDTLAAFLEQQGVSVLLDRKDISRTDTKDPFNWCVNALERAQAVLVFSNLNCCPSDLVGIHRKLDDALIAQLCVALTQGKHNVAKVLLPYCEISNFPKEVKNFRQFSLPSQLQQLVAFVKGTSQLISSSKRNDVQEVKQVLKLAKAQLLNHKAQWEAASNNTKLDTNLHLVIDSEYFGNGDSESPTSTDPDSPDIPYPNMEHLNLMGEEYHRIPRRVDTQHQQRGVNILDLKL